MNPLNMLVVVPSRLGVGESFSIKVKLRGQVREIPCSNAFNTVKPGLQGPFNLNIQRGIQYMDDCLQEWAGRLEVQCANLEGPGTLVFDGSDQGAFPGDKRPIKTFQGFRWASTLRRQSSSPSAVTWFRKS